MLRPLLLAISLLAIPALSAAAADPQDETVKQYVTGCMKKPYTGANCEQVRKDAIEILTEDIRTLGSAVDRKYLPRFYKVFKSPEPELRIAAADAIGMTGPEESDIAALIPLANDPVPDVRQAVSQMLQRGNGNALALLHQRMMVMPTGKTPETPPDLSKLGLPVAPDSSYLFYASNARVGRLSYSAKDLAASTVFFKSKAKQAPLPLDAFRDKYRYQLQDEQTVRTEAQTAASQRTNRAGTNLQAQMQEMTEFRSVMEDNALVTAGDQYPSTLFKGPTVYVLEERQVGARTYPTRYAIVYEDLALKRPGFSLSWMTASEQAITSAQAASLAEERQEKTQQEAERLQQQKEQAFEKKDAERKKQFKQDQNNLEKELGF